LQLPSPAKVTPAPPFSNWARQEVEPDHISICYLLSGIRLREYQVFIFLLLLISHRETDCFSSGFREREEDLSGPDKEVKKGLKETKTNIERIDTILA
jgi:hypothetical protein